MHLNQQHFRFRLACIESFHINGKVMDFSQALKNSSSLKPGCKSPTSSGNSPAIEPNSKALYPRSKVELTGLDIADVMKDSRIATDCRSKELACLNGGVCVPEHVGSGEDQQWTSSTLRHVCRCPSGFEGVRCETSKLVSTLTGKEDFSYHFMKVLILCKYDFFGI